MKFIYILTLSLITSLSVIGQTDVPFDKDNFKADKDAFKDANKEFETGLELYNYGPSQFGNALKHFKKAYKFNPNSALLNYYIGECILDSEHKEESVKYFEDAYKLNPAVREDIMFELAFAHHLNEDWDDAIKWYKKYKAHVQATVTKKYESSAKSMYAILDKRIEECENGKKFSSKPERVFIDNLGDNFNTKYSEFGIALSADESIMMFTSTRAGSTGYDILSEKDVEKERAEIRYGEDIYIVYKDANGKWGKPQNMGKPVNTDDHDATITISADGQSMMSYNSDNGGDIFESHLKGDEWTAPKRMDKPINSKYHDSHATYSLDGKRIYFVSNRPEDNIGQLDPNAPVENSFTHDIYYSEWNEDKGKWGDAINLGTNVNTPYNESGVFMHPDGRTLYFSSQGHTSMGGYDIFKTTHNPETDTWSKPTNLGWPVNGPDNDVFLVVSSNGRRGYYSAIHHDGRGEEDLLVITFLGPEKEGILTSEDNLLASVSNPISEKIIEPKVAVSGSKTTILKGRTLDAITHKPVESKIILTDNKKNKVVATFTSNSATGKFLVSLPSGTNYGIAVEADGYLFHSENFDLPDTADYQVVEKDIYLKSLVVGSNIVLRNVFFDVNKSTLRPESTSELERLIQLLKDAPNVKIELGGHTDSMGSDASNLTLSQNRAKAVVDFLIKGGIAANRLTSKGYGETTPVADNDTPEGRQLNRRTEFKIVGK